MIRIQALIPKFVDIHNCMLQILKLYIGDGVRSGIFTFLETAELGNTPKSEYSRPDPVPFKSRNINRFNAAGILANERHTHPCVIAFLFLKKP